MYSDDDSPAAAQPRTVEMPGKPQSCIPISHIRATHVRDDRTIDFELDGGRTMRNRLPYSCPQLAFEETFSYTASLDKLCSTDIITVLVSGNSRGASCGLGPFQHLPARPK
jgi:hypothetical protein